MACVNRLNCTRLSAISQLLLGVSNIVYGTIGVIGNRYFEPVGHIVLLVFVCTGLWLIITGAVGILGTWKASANSGGASLGLIVTFSSFSLISSVFAFNFLVAALLFLSNTFLWVFFCIGCLVGIWASVFGFYMGGRVCCGPTTTMQRPVQTSHNQIVYIQTESGPQAHILTQGANGIPVAVPAMTPGQDQMSHVEAPQDINQPPPYTATTDGTAQGGSTHDAQAPPSLETISSDLAPVYQEYTETTDGTAQGGSTHDAQAPPLETISSD